MIIEKFKSLPDNPTSSIVVIFTILYSLYLVNGVFDNFVWALLWIALRSFFIIFIYLKIIEQAGADNNKKIEVYLNGWGIVFIIYLFMYFGTGDGTSCVSGDMYGCDEYAYDESSVREHSFSEFFSNLIVFILFVTFAIFRSFSWHENIISKNDIMKSLKNIYIVIIKYIIMSPYWLSCILFFIGFFYLLSILTFHPFINIIIIMMYLFFMLIYVLEYDNWKWLDNYCDKVIKNIEK
jgi:hypothetical protein